MSEPVGPAAPVFHGDVPTGTLIMTPVADGYECRWYKFPASLPLAATYIPVSDLEFLYGGLYDRDTRMLIRPLES